MAANIQPGKFIVIYGPNNLGKTTQTQLLAQALQQQGLTVQLLKYPIYDLKPTGPIIDRALRKNHQISRLKLQQLYAQNRRDFQPQLESILNSGTWVVAEDYKGTGIAWGVVDQIPLLEIEAINKDLLEEDLTIMLDGTLQFDEAKEAGHINEQDPQRWQLGRRIHLDLAKRYNWKIVNANRDIDQVHADIMKIVSQEFRLGFNANPGGS
jgi:dTMP kinase